MQLTGKITADSLIYNADGLQVAVVAVDGTLDLRKVAVGRDFGTDIEVRDGLLGDVGENCVRAAESHNRHLRKEQRDLAEDVGIAEGPDDRSDDADREHGRDAGQQVQRGVSDTVVQTPRPIEGRLTPADARAHRRIVARTGGGRQGLSPPRHNTFTTRVPRGAGRASRLHVQ